MDDKNNNELNLILDSKLITPTITSKPYNIKVVKCGSYIQLYAYDKEKSKRIEPNFDLDLVKDNYKQTIDRKNEVLKKIDKSINNDKNKTLELKEIEMRNIIRSKLECQRLAKANMEDWQTFITLTFKENVIDVEYANKRFRYFIDKIRKNFKNFKYLCIPEFQKRGAIHYHMLCNIPYDSEIIPKRPRKNLYNPNSDSWKELEYYDIKYWNEGYSSAEPITNDCKKVVGYISKYMTKDIDNRLFGHRRYLYSINLNKPLFKFIDLENEQDLITYKELIKGKEIIYQNDYKDIYTKTTVNFFEYQ